MNRRESLKLLAGGALGGLSFPYMADAQDKWPTHPVKMIVPTAVGGTADRLTRIVAAGLGSMLHETFIVENFAGGGGIIGAQRTAQAPNDGYTFMLSYSATHASNPAVRKVSYNPVTDFTPIAMIGITPCVLVTSKNVQVADVKHLVELARKNPGKLSFGSPGAGTPSHLIIEVFKQGAGVNVTHIPYRGGNPLMMALLGAQVDAAFPSLSTAYPSIQAGKLKPLAVTTAKRHPLLPDVPTLVEAGLAPEGYFQWYGFHGPAGMPPDVVAVLHRDIGKILTAKSMESALTDEGIEVMPMTSQGFTDFVAKDYAKWGQVAKTSEIALD